MNLYIEGAKVLNSVKQRRSAVKTLVYSSQYENKKQLLALVCETLRYGSVLSQIIENLKLLKTERFLKNDNSLAQALLYDFTIGKGLVRAGKLKQTMTRHKTEIHEEISKILADSDVSSLAELLPDDSQDALPRYVRVNLIKTTVESVIMTLETEDWEYVASPATHMKRFRKTLRDLEKYQFTRDLHLSDVLVFPPGTDFHDNQLFLSGEIILQDKASCFPAHILHPPEGAVVIDSCAAPGNKTSHLASLMKDHGKIIAFDKDGRRLAILQDLTKTAGVTCVTTRCQDFLRVNPDDSTFHDVEYMLVDPSCSGSGIVSRMNQFTDDDNSSATDRLESLARFQTLILEQALRFPNVKKIVYSTCSIHTQENEEVVENVYEKVKDRFELCHIMSDWPIRGEEGYEHAQYFVRMSPEKSLTNGFFIACFKKLESLDADLHGETKNNLEERHDDLCIQVRDVKKSKNKSKKHKKSELEDSKPCLMDSTPDSHDHYTSEKVKKKKKKEKKCEENESNDEIKLSGEMDETIQKKKHKKSKHKKNQDVEPEICIVEETNCTSSDVQESQCKHKKHKRKHMDEENTISSGDHLPHKKHKHKHKNEK